MNVAATVACAELCNGCGKFMGGVGSDFIGYIQDPLRGH